MKTLAELQIAHGRLRRLEFDHVKQDGAVERIVVDIRPLKKREQDLARVNARRTVERLDPSLTTGPLFDELLEDARVVEMLSIALRKPDEPDVPWASPLEIEAKLTPPEITALWNAYVEHQEQTAPFIRDLSAEQYEAIIERIAQEGTADPLVLFATPLRNAFTITLVRELVTLRTSSSSSSSASAAPTTASTPGTESSESETSRSSDGDSSAMASLRSELESLRALYDVLNEEHAATRIRVAALEDAPGLGAPTEG